MDGPHPPQCGGACPYPLCRCATSSLPLLAFGHFPLTWGIGPLIRGVGPPGEAYGRPHGAAPTANPEATSSFTGAGPKPARRHTHRERWLRKLRRRCGTAPAAIFARSGPSGPDGTAESHSDSARRKFCEIQQVRVPRNRGLGEAVIGERSSPLRRPPASFGSFSTGKRNSPPERRNTPKNIYPADTSRRARCRTDRAKNIKI